MNVSERRMPVPFDGEGVYSEEILAGTYQGGISCYRTTVRPGCACRPQLYADRLVMLVMGRGRGYITDTVDAYNIEETCFYFPNFDKTPYQVHAITELEFVTFVIELNQWDWGLYNHTRNRLPLFRQLSRCARMDEADNTPGAESWEIIGTHQLGRIVVGGLRAEGGGTGPVTDPYAVRWYYCVGHSEITAAVGEERRAVSAGDVVMVPAGTEYSLLSEDGKETFCVLLKHFVRERDFKINPMPTHFNH